ncbi:MAG TPA: hypothetical protein VMT18_13830, partial [Planctomycetota bacterium]|nr:hypothetical protein [Planctomycetota bacterium]
MLAELVGIVLASLPVQQDREVSRLTKQALDRDPVESRAAIEHLAAFGERGVPGLGTVLAKGRVLSRSMALVELRTLGGAAASILPAVAALLPAGEPAPAEDLLQAIDEQARAARRARINVSVEKSLSEWSGAAWDERELELYEAALAADALCAVARADLAAGLEACLKESKRARRVREGYESALVALARAARGTIVDGADGEQDPPAEASGEDSEEAPPAETEPAAADPLL